MLPQLGGLELATDIRSVTVYLRATRAYWEKPPNEGAGFLASEHPLREIRRPEGGDDRFLDGLHSFALCGLLVIVAGKVKQSMNEVAEDFAGQGFSEIGGLAHGHFRADDNFAVMERDHVGGSLNVHEITVNPLAGGVVHQGDLDGGEVAQRGILQSGMVDGEDGSVRGDFL